jgi:hypothetical protein
MAKTEFFGYKPPQTMKEWDPINIHFQKLAPISPATKNEPSENGNMQSN